MAAERDITITLPAEHFDALAAVISSGLKHARITSESRKALEAWWTAESEFVQDALGPQDKDEG